MRIRSSRISTPVPRIPRAGVLLVAVAAVCGAHAQTIPVLTVGKAIEGRYIVTMRPDVANVQGEVDKAMKGRQGRAERVFQRAMKGFAARLTPTDVDVLRRHPNVLAV